NLVQSMRDEDDGDTAGFQITQYSEEAVRLGNREARRRFVHDDDACVERQRLGDLKKLALGYRQVGDGSLGREIAAETVKQGPHCVAKATAVDQSQGATHQGLAAE